MDGCAFWKGYVRIGEIQRLLAYIGKVIFLFGLDAYLVGHMIIVAVLGVDGDFA